MNDTCVKSTVRRDPREVEKRRWLVLRSRWTACKSACGSILTSLNLHRSIKNSSIHIDAGAKAHVSVLDKPSRVLLGLAYNIANSVLVVYWNGKDNLNLFGTPFWWFWSTNKNILLIFLVGRHLINSLNSKVINLNKWHKSS